MAKKVIKEVIIILLLCLAVILLLGVLFYDYIPMAKVIPNEVSYTKPAIVKEELTESSEIDESKVVMTYEVDGTDLTNFTNMKDYRPGKANPFSSYETSIPSNSENTTGNGNTNSGSNANSSSSNGSTNNSGSSNNGNTASNGNTTNNNSSNTTSNGGYYFQNKGTK